MKFSVAARFFFALNPSRTYFSVFTSPSLSAALQHESSYFPTRMLVSLACLRFLSFAFTPSLLPKRTLHSPIPMQAGELPTRRGEKNENSKLHREKLLVDMTIIIEISVLLGERYFPVSWCPVIRCDSWEWRIGNVGGLAPVWCNYDAK